MDHVIGVPAGKVGCHSVPSGVPYRAVQLIATQLCAPRSQSKVVEQAGIAYQMLLGYVPESINRVWVALKSKFVITGALRSCLCFCEADHG